MTAVCTTATVSTLCSNCGSLFDERVATFDFSVLDVLCPRCARMIVTRVERLSRNGRVYDVTILMPALDREQVVRVTASSYRAAERAAIAELEAI